MKNTHKTMKLYIKNFIFYNELSYFFIQFNDNILKSIKERKVMLNLKSMAHLIRQKVKDDVANNVMANINTINCKKQNKISSLLRVFALSGILVSCAYANGGADSYIRASIEEMFSDTSNFECVGGNRSAECRVDRYEISSYNGLALQNYRYTVDYKESRVIERTSSNIEVNNNYEYKELLPKYFECSDFTQLHNDKNQINEQLVCSIRGDLYTIWFRLRAKANSPLFEKLNTMELMKKSSIVLTLLTKEIKGSLSENEKFEVSKIFKDFNVDLYGIDIAITKPKLSQKIYEYMFADYMPYYDDELEDNNTTRYSQVSKTLYNSGVGYIYGRMMGYVWGNDSIDDRTKKSLNNLFVALRDSSMLDSNIRSVYITIVNRTKKGFNLGKAIETITNESVLDISRLNKHKAGNIINLFSGDIFNRYRIEAQALKSKNHDY